MARTCSVCAHPDRDSIDIALVAGKPLRDIAGQHALSTSALHRHAQGHLPETVKAAYAVKEQSHAVELLGRVENLIYEAEGLLKHGKKEKQSKAWASGISELRKTIELLARVTGELDERPVINFIAQPEWVEIRTLILSALDPFPEAREKVLDALSTD
jgi:hypothetical protein